MLDHSTPRATASRDLAALIQTHNATHACHDKARIKGADIDGRR